MKLKKFLILLLLFFCCSCNYFTDDLSNDDTSNSNDDFLNADINENETNVVIFAGQSNMEGNSYLENLYQNCSPEDALLYKQGFENVQICYGNASFTRKIFSAVKAGQGQTSVKFGPELGFAQYLSEKFPEQKTYIIKYAVGGTSIYEHWASPASVEEGIRPAVGIFYNPFLEYVHLILSKMRENGMNPVVRAICWMQGESDSSVDKYRYYEDLENNLINDLQQEFYDYSSDFGIRFIDAGISDSSAWRVYKEINIAKKNNQEKDPAIRFYIDTISENLEYNKEPSLGNVDFYHYDSIAMIKLGRLFAEKYASIMNF